ncbi:MAG: aromatic ring-hydroxylating dioxygenase subunit alpha [Pseudomonadota bacterium]
MSTSEQIALLDELLELHEQKQQFLDEQVTRRSVDNYSDPNVFKRERDTILRQQPQMVLHASELSGPGSYIVKDVVGMPLLLVRDQAGEARAFYNVCRHRGARLVGEGEGCKRRFICPYHAWTYNTDGKLIGVPHEKSGFPDLDREQLGLTAVACAEYGGWIWVSLAPGDPMDIKTYLGELDAEFLALEGGSHVVAGSTTEEYAANWKILAEGGLEAYHFRVAHKNTIAPLFLDNLSSYQIFGDHMRSVLPRSNLPELQDKSKDDINFGSYANMLYTFFPASQFLVQEDHIVWIHSTALAPDCTRLRITTLVPKANMTEEMTSYWQKNHELTMMTLKEDFDLGEGIQEGVNTPANTHINFGRFEGALDQFNRIVERNLS